MPAERYDPATVELVAGAVHDYACMGDGCSWSEEALPCDLAEFAGFGVAVLDALAAARWINLSRVSGYLVNGRLHRPDDVQILMATETATEGGDHA
jgi:hypothetical protein